MELVVAVEGPGSSHRDPDQAAVPAVPALAGNRIAPATSARAHSPVWRVQRFLIGKLRTKLWQQLWIHVEAEIRASRLPRRMRSPYERRRGRAHRRGQARGRAPWRSHNGAGRHQAELPNAASSSHVRAAESGTINSASQQQGSEHRSSKALNLTRGVSLDWCQQREHLRQEDSTKSPTSGIRPQPEMGQCVARRRHGLGGSVGSLGRSLLLHDHCRSPSKALKP